MTIFFSGVLVAISNSERRAKSKGELPSEPQQQETTEVMISCIFSIWLRNFKAYYALVLGP